MADTFFDSGEKIQPQGVTLDFKRVLARAIRFWYVILFSLIVAITFTFFKNRYAIPVYPVSTSVIIRETEETGGAELLYKNALIDPYKNYLNEPYILKSYPLLQQVVEDLNFDMTFQREGRILTLDAYGQIPIVARLTQKNGSYGKTLFFRIINENSFGLKSGESEKEEIFEFGKEITFLTHHLIFKIKGGENVDSFINKEFKLLIQDPHQVARMYSARLDIEWAEVGSGILNLSLTGTVPQKEIDFLNGLILRYQQNDLDRKNLAASRTVVFINEQLTNITDSLRFFEGQLERFKNKNVTTNLEGEAMRFYQQLETLEVQKMDLKVRGTYYQYIKDNISKGDNLDQIILPSSLGITDDVLSGLISKMIDFQMEARMVLGSEKNQNPLVIEKQKKINEIKGDIIESLKTMEATDKIKLEYLENQTKNIERQMNKLPLAERQLVSIKRNYGLQESLYVFLMQKKAEADISKASNTSDVIVVNPPGLAGGSISPRKSRNYSIALALGLIIPLGLFVLLEFFNNKVQSKEDIDKVTSIPFIGGIGHNASTGNLTVKEKPKSGLAESFRALRSNLNFFTGNQTKKVFMVSSSISGEGKTFTTINLATVFAMSGKKTLIVGADMRRPRIFQDFNRANELGLSTFLSGLSDFDSVVQGTEIENLFLVSGGPVPPNPSELLLTNKFGEFIKKALETYDFVLLDTPPLALVTDAFVMSKFADHTVFVMRQNYSPKEFVHSIDEYYRSGKIKNISILLNDISKSGLGYGYGQSYAYQYGYGYGYGYGNSRKDGNGYYSDN